MKEGSWLNDLTKEHISKTALFILIPFIYVLPGSIYSTTYTNINWINFISLLVFVLINNLLEYILDSRDLRINFSLLSLELANIGLIIYFYISQSVFLGNILLLYTILLQTQYIFNDYHLNYLAPILTATFKVFLLNGISFYLSTNFLTNSLLISMSPYFFPIFLSKLMRWKNANPFIFISLLLLSYLISIIILWNHIGFWSLSLLLLLPLAYKLLNKRTYSNTRLFTVLFSYVTLSLFILSLLV